MESAGLNILITDPAYRRYCRMIQPVLDGGAVIVAIDHKKACELFTRRQVDLALLSHHNPAVCLDTIRAFKATKPQVPLIVIADKGSEAFAVAAFRMGVRDYLRKPVDPSELEASIRAALGMQRPSDKGYDTYSLGRIDRAIQHIHNHYRSRLKLRDAARVAGMSSSHFCRFFRKETGMRFTAYVNNFRIAKAIDMLRDNGKTMSEIAFACGFTNQFHFSRTFKKFARTSPVKFRRSMNDGHLLTAPQKRSKKE